MLKILLFILCFFCLFTPAFAAEKESLAEFSEVEKLWEMLPDGMDSEEIRPFFDENQNSDFSSLLLNLLKSAFSLGLAKGSKTLFSLCALILIAALFRAIKDSFPMKDLEGAFDFVFLLALALVLFSSLEDCIRLCYNAFQAIQSFFLASLPITTILLTLSGSPGSAAALSASLNLVLGFATTLTTTYLSPLLHSLYALSLTDGITGSSMGSILRFFKKSLKTLSILFFTLVSAALTLNNALAYARDSLAMRSVRFAAGNFIPVIGSLIGESAKTLAAAFSLIKTQCGILCLVVIFYIILRPVFCIVVQKGILSLAGAMSEMLSDSIQVRFFQAISSLLDLLLTLLLSEGCYLVFYITLFLTNKGSF